MEFIRTERNLGFAAFFETVKTFLTFILICLLVVILMRDGAATLLPQKSVPEWKEQQTRQEAEATHQVFMAKSARRAQWVRYSSFFYIGFLVTVLCMGFAVSYRKTRPMIELRNIGEDGKEVITRIPVMKATSKERQYVAFAPVVKNLAMANKDMKSEVMELWGAFLAGANTAQSIRQQASPSSPIMAEQSALLSANQAPSLLDVCRNKSLVSSEGHVLIGFQRGTDSPHYVPLEQVITMGVAGRQGSGKTWTSAYFLLAAHAAYHAEGYILDPHWQHKSSLTARVQPLIDAGVYQWIPPTQIYQHVKQIESRLDNRLTGRESCETPIIVLFDEFPWLLRQDKGPLADVVRFLERCTEEARKARIIFVGSSTKWTAKYFGGRADIRRGLNSIFLHNMKVKEADLLLDGGQCDKALLTRISQPGEAVFIPDYGEPVELTLPYLDTDMFTAACHLVCHDKGLKPGHVLTQGQPQEIFDVDEIQDKLKQAKQHMTLPQLWERCFPTHDVPYETFKKKFYSPELRPWNHDEQIQLARVV